MIVISDRRFFSFVVSVPLIFVHVSTNGRKRERIRHIFTIRSLIFFPPPGEGPLNVERTVEQEPARREDEKETGRGEGGREGAADRIMGTHTPEHVCLASCGGPEVSAAHYGAP